MGFHFFFLFKQHVSDEEQLEEVKAEEDEVWDAMEMVTENSRKRAQNEDEFSNTTDKKKKKRIKK